MIECVKELLQAHPALRRAMLLTGSESLENFYAKGLGVWNMKEESNVIVMSKKAFDTNRSQDVHEGDRSSWWMGAARR